MSKTEVKLNWLSVDMSTLPAELVDSFEAIGKARKLFESKFSAILEARKAVPRGNEPRYGYKWGRLSLAFQPKDGEADAPTAKTFRL